VSLRANAATNILTTGMTVAAPNIREFLLRVLPWPGDDALGCCNVHVQWHIDGKAIWTGRPFRSVDQFINFAQYATTVKSIPDVYMCLSLQAKHSQKTDKQGNFRAAKHAQDALFSKAIYLDVDIKDPPKGYATLGEAKAVHDFRVAAKLPPASATVASGGGLHVYWINDRPLTPEQWRPYAMGLKALAQAHKLRCDLGVTGDIARVLRIPGTFNMKTGMPRKVDLITLEKDYNFATELKHITSLVPVTNVTTPGNWFEGTLPSSIPDIFKS
jgi:hypothetical protein